MSTAFTLKQAKMKKNVRNLTISMPILSQSSRPISHDSQTSVIVLVAKYDFVGEMPGELSVKKGSFVRLLSRPGNGWLKVSCLDKLDDTGIVPASYVDIVVNDKNEPIDLEWLNYIEPLQSDKSAAIHDNDLFDFETGYPTKAVIDQVLQDECNKFWYKITISFQNNRTVYIGKAFPEFYAFHGALMNKFHHKLPKLPVPRLSPSINGNKMDKFLFVELSERCQKLHTYFNLLIQDPMINQSEEMEAFVNDCRHVSHDNNITPQQVVDMLNPNSTDVKDLYDETLLGNVLSQTSPLPLYSSFSSTKPLEQLKKSTSTHNIHQLLANSEESNLKYSSYIKQVMRKENSENSIRTYASLIDKYDDSISSESQTTNEESTGGSYHTDPSSFDEGNGIQRESFEENLNDQPIKNVFHYGLNEVGETPEKSFGRNVYHFSDSSLSRNHHRASSDMSDIPAKPPLRSQSDIFGDIKDRPLSNNDSLSSQTAPCTPEIRDRDMKWGIGSPLTPNTPVYEEEHDDDEFVEDPIMPLVIKKRQDSKVKEDMNNDFIKIKIYLDNDENDVIAVKIKRSNLISIIYLKKLLSYKIYRDYLLVNHYHLRVKHGGTMDDETLLKWIKTQTKASLVLVRSR